MARVGPYEVLEAIGRGGVGAVFRARAPDGRIVAWKVLGRTTPDSLARFDRERRIQTALGEGFVSLIDAGSSESGPYLVMPLLEGGTLRARLEKGALAPDEAAALVRSLAG